MEIVESFVIGLGVAFLAMIFLRSSEAKLSATLAVGAIGALLGLAIHVGMGHKGIIDISSSERLASAYGAGLALFLWIVAQRLFLQTPRTSHE